MKKRSKTVKSRLAAGACCSGTGWFFWPLFALNILLIIWCGGAIWFQRRLPNPFIKGSILAVFLLGSIFFVAKGFERRWFMWLPLLLCAVVIAAWLTLLHPTGKQNWDTPFIRMPKSTFSPDGNTVTIENIRDFHYRAERDYDVRYRTESYCLNDVVSMDYSITHWNGSEPFGHIILSFLFKDGRRLAVSPEARLEKDEIYEILPGFYRWYELIFIVATEEDVFQLRTHHRRYEQEEVLLYETNTQPEVAAFILKDLLLRANKLMEKPEFYNGLFYNCLSSMAPTAEKLGFNFCSNLRGTFNGYSDRTGFYSGWLRREKADESFADYRKRHSVNQYVEHLTDPANYSDLLRSFRNVK